MPFGAQPSRSCCPEPLGEALEEAAVQLFRIGYDRVVGRARRGRRGLGARPVRRVETLTRRRRSRRSTRDAVAGRNAYALDVRDPHEWRDDGVVPGAIQIPLGELPDRLASHPA